MKRVIRCNRCRRTFQAIVAPGDEWPGRCSECDKKHFVSQYYWPYGSKAEWDKAHCSTGGSSLQE